jgi:hypothetical protein
VGAYLQECVTQLQGAQHGALKMFQFSRKICRGLAFGGVYEAAGERLKVGVGLGVAQPGSRPVAAPSDGWRRLPPPAPQGSKSQLSLLNIITELKKCCNHPFLFNTAEVSGLAARFGGLGSVGAVSGRREPHRRRRSRCSNGQLF